MALGIAVADNGTVYFKTHGSSTKNYHSSYLVKKIDPNGVVSFFAGQGNSGFKDGKKEVAQFNFIIFKSNGVAVYKDNVYVADSNNYRIRKITPDGTVTTFAGGGKKYISSDPQKLEAKITDEPLDIVINSKGDLFFSTSLGTKIYKIIH